MMARLPGVIIPADRSAARIHPRSPLPASGAENPCVRLWEAAGGKEVDVYKAHATPVGNLLFTPDGNQVPSFSSDPDGKLLAMGNGGGVVLWNAVTGEQVKAWTLQESVGGVAFSADSR
jgi:WD40 repeat protein